MLTKSQLSTGAKYVISIPVPTLIPCTRINRRAPRDWNQEDFLRFRDRWALESSDSKRAKRDAMILLYQDTMNRMAGFESKGIGILQAIGIVAAGALIALTGPTASKVLAAIGLAYLTTSGVACGTILFPRMRFQLTIQDLEGHTDGYAEMAATIETMEPIGIRAANLVTSAMKDLMRGVILTLAALVAFLMSVPSPSSHNSPTPAVTRTLPTPQASSSSQSHKPQKPRMTGRSSNQPRPSAT